MTIFNLHLNHHKHHDHLNHLDETNFFSRKHRRHKLLDKMIFRTSTKNTALTISTATTTWWWLFSWKKYKWENIDENRQSSIGKLEKVIEKFEKKNEKFEVDTSISTYFNDAEEILDRNYLEKIENEKEELKEIEREYNFSHILEQINDGVTPEEIKFYFSGDNKNFFKHVQA